MKSKKDIIRMVIGVMTLIAVVTGGTYAWFSWKSSNISISGTTGCFDIIYDGGQAIGSTDSPYSLMPSCNYNEGSISAEVTMNIDSACTTTGVASINLKSTAFTLYDGTNAFDRDDEVLKYQVVEVATETVDGVETTTENPIEECSGYITSSSNTSLCEVELSHTPTKYKVYLYLDCNTVTTSYIGSSYSGYIQTVATQIVE
jgi:hypothetical protein